MLLGTTPRSEQKAWGAQSSAEVADHGPLDACPGQGQCYRVLFPCAVAELQLQCPGQALPKDSLNIDSLRDKEKQISPGLSCDVTVFSHKSCLPGMSFSLQ